MYIVRTMPIQSSPDLWKTSRTYVSINFYCKLSKKGKKVKCLITHWINVTFNWRTRISKGLFINSASSPTLYRYKWKWVKVSPRLLSALMWLWLPNLSKWHLFWPIGSIINKYNQQWAFYHQLHSEYLSWVFYWGSQYHNWNAFSCNRQKNHHYDIRKLWQNNLVMPKNQGKQVYLELG